MSHLAQAISISQDTATQGIGTGLLVVLVAVGLFLVILCLPFLGSLL